jgi:hypothetical protein
MASMLGTAPPARCDKSGSAASHSKSYTRLALAIDASMRSCICVYIG